MSRLDNSDRAGELFERAVIVDANYAKTWQVVGMLEALLVYMYKTPQPWTRNTSCEISDERDCVRHSACRSCTHGCGVGLGSTLQGADESVEFAYIRAAPRSP